MPEPDETRPLGDPTGQVFVPADDAAPETSEAPVEEPRRSLAKALAAVSGRLLLGIVVLAGVAAVVAAATLLPLQGVTAKPVSTVVQPVPTPAELVCPGGLLRLGTSTGADANAATAIGEPQFVGAASAGDILTKSFASSNASSGSGAAPSTITTPAGSAGALVGAAQSESVATGDFSGLSSAACGAPTEDVWLAGGSTAVGRTTLLLLANPTAVDATVSVQVFGETGPVTAPGMDGIVVSAGSQRVLSIAGFAPGLSSPVVHVTSSGGQVLADLEQTTVRGVDPGGSDFIGPQGAPSRHLVLPGVVISGSQGIQSLLGQSGYEDLQPTLRIFTPGPKRAMVSITVIAEDGTVVGKPTTAKLQAGTVNDVPLDSLSEGSYTLELSSTAPIVAGARVSTAVAGTTPPTNDFAWVTAAPMLDAPTMIAIANGMTPTLHLANPTSTTETVRVRGLAGDSQTVTVNANSATSVPVQAGLSYELEGFTQLYASVSGATDGGITSYSVPASTAGSAPVRVFG